MIDFEEWYRKAFGNKTPWGDEDSPAVVTEVESGLERDSWNQGWSAVVWFITRSAITRMRRAWAASMNSWMSSTVP